MKLRNSTRKLSYAQKRLNNGEHHAKGLYGYGELQLVKVKGNDYFKKYLKVHNLMEATDDAIKP